VIRPHGSDYRGYAGAVASGVLRVGDEVVVLPRGQVTRITGIDGPHGEVDEAHAPLSVTVRLADDVDVARGDLLAPVAGAPEPVRDLAATLCWLSDEPARPGGRYLVKHATRTVRARLEQVEHRLDVTTMARRHAAAQRHRTGAPAAGRAPGDRPVRRVPRDGRVHPRRRGDQRHGCGGDGAGRLRRPWLKPGG
jgi:bifunctional enzyme CysN/CysC